MFSAEVYTDRRKKLAHSLSNKGLILILGNNDCPVNYTGNVFRFRQDSNFLYFAGINLQGLAITIDTATGATTLFGDDIPAESAVWTGTVPTMKSWAEKAGITAVKPFKDLSVLIKTQGTIHYLPPYPHDRKILLSDLLGKTIAEVNTGYSVELIKAIVELRSYKTPDEIAQIEDSLNSATAKFHIEAMKMAKEGYYEYEIAGQIESTMLRNHCQPAYGIICSVHGEILHNVHYHNQLKEGQLLLIDAGAENKMCYASDITRTTPVGGKFSNQQKEIYNLVLSALTTSIEKIKPGIPYRDIHIDAARLMTKGLVDLGIMKGDVDEIVQAGAHALFFPHGLGHMLGLDVHDMEDLGEQYVGYGDSYTRSEQFGTAYLRLARKLEEGFVITVEPGLYFIPILIEKWKSENKFANFINYNALTPYMEYGGTRIEDNILVTANGSKILGDPIPKSIEEIEGLF